MKFLHESKGRIHCSCNKCGNIMNVPSIDCTKEETGDFKVRYEVKCSKCRNESWIINVKKSSNDEIKCPICASTKLSANTKGFSLGKAAVGGVLLGSPIGLLGGMIGSKKIAITCLRCGHKWNAGERK